MIPRAGIPLAMILACCVWNMARIMSWHSWQTARSRMWRSRAPPANLRWRRSYIWTCFPCFLSGKIEDHERHFVCKYYWCYLWLTICMPRISEGALLAYSKLKIVANDSRAMAVMQFQQVLKWLITLWFSKTACKLRDTDHRLGRKRRRKLWLTGTKRTSTAFCRARLLIDITYACRILAWQFQPSGLRLC